MSNSGTQNGISRHKKCLCYDGCVCEEQKAKAKGKKSIPKVKVIFFGFQNQPKIELQHENKA